MEVDNNNAPFALNSSFDNPGDDNQETLQIPKINLSPDVFGNTQPSMDDTSSKNEFIMDSLASDRSMDSGYGSLSAVRKMHNRKDPIEEYFRMVSQVTSSVCCQSNYSIILLALDFGTNARIFQPSSNDLMFDL